MAIELWLAVIIFIVGVAIIIKLVGKALKSLGFIVLLFVLINLAFGFMMYRDVSDLKEHFFTEPSLYALQDGDEIKAAISFAFPKEEGKPTLDFATSKSLSKKTNALRIGDLEVLKGDNYKLFVMNREFAEAIVAEEIDFGSSKLSKNDTLNILFAESSFDAFVEKFTGKTVGEIGEAGKQQLLEQMGLEDEEQHRSFFFLMAVVQGMFSKGPEGLLTSMEQYKKKNLVVYKDTIFFKSFKIVPVSFLRSMSAKIAQKTGR